MGCFLGCFGTPKKGGKKRRKAARSLLQDAVWEGRQPLLSSPVLRKLIEAPVADGNSPAPSTIRNEVALLIPVKTKKKVRFDLNVTVHELGPTHEDERPSLDVGEQEEVKEERKPLKEAYPLHHRYQNYTISNDECSEEDEFEFGDSDFDDDSVGGSDQEEESFDSYFSLQMDKWQDSKEVCSAKTSSATSADAELVIPVNRNTRNRNEYVNSVLNPVGNISQWKEVKAKQQVPLKPTEKENNKPMEDPNILCSSDQNIITTKPLFDSTTRQNIAKQDFPVEASLSSWLESPITTNINACQDLNACGLSSLAIVDRNNKTGATEGENKFMSKLTDEMPVWGTVGSYLNHSGHKTTRISD